MKRDTEKKSESNAPYVSRDRSVERDGRKGPFSTTHWSVVRAAGANHSEDGRVALESLCRTYWPAVYSFLRQRGFPLDDAQDLTQDYFYHLIEDNLPGQADSDKGKFRTFLLLTLQHFVSDRFRRARAQKRVPEQRIIRMDSADLERICASDYSAALSPEEVFDRRWAEALVAGARQRLADEYGQKDNERFRELARGFLPGGQMSESQAAAAERLGLSENTVKVRVHRLRQRFAELVREEIANTVSDREDAAEELAYLVTILSRPT